MEATMEAILWVVVFVAGLAVRAAIAVAFVAVLALPITLLLLAAQRGYRLWQRLSWTPSVDGHRYDARAYYAEGHTWLRRAGRELSVGLDDLAQRLLAGTDAIDLPSPGRIVRAGEIVGAVRCGDKRAGIVTPVAGTIAAVNDAVARDPSLIHRDPYGRGWLYRVAPSDVAVQDVRHGPEARAWLREENGRLGRFLEHELGLAAADGGEPIAPPPSLLTAEQWQRLARAFLSSN
jgi:glycine cleavage system H lipoate-binding protein